MSLYHYQIVYRSLTKKNDEMEKVTKHTFDYENVTINIKKNDLIRECSDAIVNPANSQLKHEGGAARAISDAAGPEFHKECQEYLKKYFELPTGSSMVTSAGGSL